MKNLLFVLLSSITSISLSAVSVFTYDFNDANGTQLNSVLNSGSDTLLGIMERTNQSRGNSGHLNVGFTAIILAHLIMPSLQVLLLAMFTEHLILRILTLLIHQNLS